MPAIGVSVEASTVASGPTTGYESSAVPEAVAERCRRYLLLIANQELSGDLQGKFSPSDLVQETFLEAHRRSAEFTGRSESELRAWMRQILLNNLHDSVRRYRRVQKRAVTRERRLTTHHERQIVGRPCDAPSEAAKRNEEQARLRRALAALSEDHRRAVELRNFEFKSFAEVGRMLNRSPEAARKLWDRAILELELRLGDDRGC